MGEVTTLGGSQFSDRLERPFDTRLVLTLKDTGEGTNRGEGEHQRIARAEPERSLKMGEPVCGMSRSDQRHSEKAWSQIVVVVQFYCRFTR